MTLAQLVRSHRKRVAAPLVGYPLPPLTNATALGCLQDAEEQTAALLAYRDAAGPDVLFTFMDLSVEAEALGCDVVFHRHSSPDVKTHPVATPDDIDRLTLPDVDAEGRFGVFVDTIAAVAGQADVPVAGYVASPYTLAGLLAGAETTAMNTVLAPDFVRRLLGFSADLCIEYAVAQVRAGAAFIVLLEPSGVMLSPSAFEELVNPEIERIVAAVEAPIVLHVCGRTTDHIPVLARTGVEGLSLDSDVDFPSVAPSVGEDTVLIGNIHPVRTMQGASPAQVRAAVCSLLHRMSEHGNFVPSTGCDVPPEAPFENVRAFIEAVHEAE